jgi:hypothetical protein
MKRSLWGWVIVVIVVLFLFNSSKLRKPSQTAPVTGEAAPSLPAKARTTSAEIDMPAPPSFKVYKQSSTLPTSVVVRENTTDSQLRSLLWLFRQKVRSHEFKAIKLTMPTSTNFGKKNWDSGMIVVYRGVKCASEIYATKGLGPCGYGDHAAASYQWGINGDASKDSGDLSSADGDLTVFDYKDGWLPPPNTRSKPKIEVDAHKTEGESNRAIEATFATQLQSRVSSLGFDMLVHPGPDADELTINSKMFQDDSGQVQFLSTVLPHWRKDLCRAGYRTLHLKSGTFSIGNEYSIECH